MFNYPYSKFFLFFLNFIRNSFFATCICCLLSYQCALLRRMWLCLLHIFPLSNWKQLQDLPWTFTFGWTNLVILVFSHKYCMYSSPLTILVMCWTHSSLLVPFVYRKVPDWTQVLHLLSHTCWREGKNHFCWPPGYGLANMAQYAVRLLCLESILLIPVQFVVHQSPQILSCKAAF